MFGLEDPPLKLANGKLQCAENDGDSPLGDIMDWLGYGDLGDAANELVGGLVPPALPPKSVSPTGSATSGNSDVPRARKPSQESFAVRLASSSNTYKAARDHFIDRPPNRQTARPTGTLFQDLPANVVLPEHLRKGGGLPLPQVTSPSSAADDSAGPPLPLFRARVKKKGEGGGYCGLVGGGSEDRNCEEPEEDEWEQRKQQTGAAGRLVIYDARDCPQQDMQLRGGGPNMRRIMVTTITEGGKAAQAGVKAGDVLVSIDGKKDFAGLTADEVHSSLGAPVMLVFMGFVGKLQAEVRLNYKQKTCGLSSRHQVTMGRQDETMQLTDAVGFSGAVDELNGRRGPSTTLFLATTPRQPYNRQQIPTGDQDQEVHVVSDNEPSSSSAPADHGAAAGPVGGNGTFEQEAARPTEAFYELHGQEARNLVSRALARMQVNPASTPTRRRQLQTPGVLAQATAGDHAQEPRSMMPAPSPFAARFDAQAAKANSLPPSIGQPPLPQADMAQADGKAQEWEVSC
mmetsp:Transcript_35154/g.90332  ORF Transcript_35154/g.90332 Transcript_35154/m.90332 type:complete len:515 (-) Transcript_35154:66-1610(-)